MLIDKGLVFRRLRQYAIRTWETTSTAVDVSSSITCDLWLVCHPKDFEVAKLTLESARLFVLNRIEKIYLVSTLERRPQWLPSEIEYIYEGSIQGVEEVSRFLDGEIYRGWILQQLLKYSGAFYSHRFVVIDCDTVLLKPHLYFSEKGTVLRLAYEHSPQYRDLEKSLDINACRWASFVCHMMPFEGDVLHELFRSIEANSGMDWRNYFAFFSKKRGMVMSEWDLYARFLIQERHPYQFRPWINQSLEVEGELSLESLIEKFSRRRNSVSLHRSERPLVIKSRI